MILLVLGRSIDGKIGDLIILIFRYSSSDLRITAIRQGFNR